MSSPGPELQKRVGAAESDHRCVELIDPIKKTPQIALDRENTQAPDSEVELSGVPGDPAPDHRERRMVLLIVAVLIVVAALVAWMFRGFSLVRLFLPDSVAAQSNSSATPTNVRAEPVQSPGAEERLFVWVAQAEPSIEAMLMTRDEVSAAAVNADIAGIQRACASGPANVARVQERLPSPDSALNAALQQTLDDYRMGFNECLAGTRDQDPGAIELAAVYLHRANDDLRTVMAVIASDLGGFDQSQSDVVSV